jgi:phospholipid/cholesterol/gamma-HCH transport system substrate-binding protein
VRRHRSRVSNLTAGLVAAIVVLVVCYLVFGGSIPFSGTPFQLKATFTAETQLHLASPVRIAGVEVGTVTSVKRVGGSSTAAVVTMAIQPNGLPIHADATVDIRPRLFLEGNFYVDLHPGTPAAPTVSSGHTLPVANTTGPVQLDRVLSALNSNTRANLQTLVRGYGGALNRRPTAAQDASQDPTQRGLTAGQSLNQSLAYAAGAFKASAIVNGALLGSRPQDLSGVVSGTQRVFGALAADTGRLSDLVSTLNATMGALSDQQGNLQETIALLPGTLQATDDALGPVQASFAPTRQFARELTPSIRQLGPTIAAGLPWLSQSIALLSPQELRGLLASLTPAIQGTSATLTATESLLNGSNALARCFVHDIIPTGNQRISDPPVTTGLQVYQELFQSAVGLASSSQDFDGNGRYLRASTGGGGQQVATSSLPGGGPLYGNAVLSPLGTRPAFAGKAPAVRSDVACYRNPEPALNRVTTGTGP